jgi:hypothetical protein
MKKTIIFLLPFIIVVLTIIHVVVSNMISTAGVELDNLQTNLADFQKKNTILRQQVLIDSSLSHIASVAAEMGFIDPKSNVYLSAPLPLAKR